jgi:hypothetical protein
VAARPAGPSGWTAAWNSGHFRRESVWYDDQRAAHDQIYQGDETIEYSFMGANPEAADNRWLREAMQKRI